MKGSTSVTRPKAGVEPSLRDARLGHSLRQLREKVPLNGHSVAVAAGWSDSKVSRIETGNSVIRRADLEKLLVLYQATSDRRRDLLAYFDEMVSRPVRAADPIDHAHALLEWAPTVVPEILQTTLYMRAVLAELQLVQLTPPSEIDVALDLSLARQSRLTTGNPPLTMKVIIGEAALGNGFGDASVMRDQLEQLIARAALPGVEMRIMRAGSRAGGPRSLSAFVCLSFPALHATALPDMVTIPAMVPIRLNTEPETWPHIVAFRKLWDLADPDPVPVLKAHRAKWARAEV